MLATGEGRDETARSLPVNGHIWRGVRPVKWILHFFCNYWQKKLNYKGFTALLIESSARIGVASAGQPQRIGRPKVILARLA
jgi:hypothetical protein